MGSVHRVPQRARQGRVDIGPMSRILRNVPDSPDIVRPRPWHSAVTGSKLPARANPIRARSASAIVTPHFEGTQGLAGQHFVRPYRLNWLTQHRCFPAWGEAPSHIPGCFHSSSHHGAIADRATCEQLPGHDRDGRTWSRAAPSRTSPSVQPKNASHQPKASP
jgi:hypothetical protein